MQATLSPSPMATILIVDDHRVTRLGLAEMLADAGYSVVTTGNFQEARRILREEPPDLLIADVRLGSFNGLQLVISGLAHKARHCRGRSTPKTPSLAG